MTTAFDAYRGSYEEVVESSIAFSGRKHEFFLQAKADLLAEIFGERFGPSKPALLDVGCGVGRLHPLIGPLTRSLTGTDVSHESLARAGQDNANVDYVPQTPTALPFEDRTFDAALAVCVLHHVPQGERDALVSEMRRVVRPGGLVTIIEHNPFNPLTRLAVARCPFDHDAVLLGAGETGRLLGRAGLRGIEQRHFLLLPTSGPWTSRLERLFRRVPLGAQFAAFGEV